MAATLVLGKTLRWASQGDVLSFDPHTFNGGLNNAFTGYVHDALVHYDR